MTLGEIIDLFDRNREYLKLQIGKEDGWKEYDEIYTYNSLLKLLLDKEIKAIEAVDEDTLRVDLKW